MVIQKVTAREEAEELLTTFLARKGIEIDAIDIEIMANIINLFVKASFQEGSGKLREVIIQSDSARLTRIEEQIA